MSGRDASTARFLLHRPPTRGSLLLQAAGGLQVPAITWKVQQMRDGLLRYLHHDGGGDNDTIMFNVTIASNDEVGVEDENESYGPFRLQLAVADRQRPMLLVTRNLTVAAGSSAIINSSNLRALLPSGGSDESRDDEEASSRLRFLITRSPAIGRLLVDGEPLPTSGGATAQFSLAQLVGGRLIFTTLDVERRLESPLRHITDPLSASTSIALRVCDSRSCSDETRLHIRVEIENRQG